MVHAAGEPLTPAAIVKREEAPHLPTAVMMPAIAPPPHDEPAASPRGTDSHFFTPYCALWDWLRQYLEDEPLVHHEGEGPLPVSKHASIKTAVGK